MPTRCRRSQQCDRSRSDAAGPNQAVREVRSDEVNDLEAKKARSSRLLYSSFPTSSPAVTPSGYRYNWEMESSDDHPVHASLSRRVVQSATRGDRAALREIYEATSDRVFRLMVRMVGQQDADDLTQQTFVQAFTKMSQFSGDSKFETWLYRVATNEALQHLRREKHRRTKELVVEPTVRHADHVDQDER